METKPNSKRGVSLFARNPRFFITWLSPCRLVCQFPHPQQVIGGPDKPACQLRSQQSFITGPWKASNRLHPPKNLLHSLSGTLAQYIPYMRRRSSIDGRTSAPLPIFGYMRAEPSTPQHRHKLAPIIGFISTQGPSSIGDIRLNHSFFPFSQFWLSSPIKTGLCGDAVPDTFYSKLQKYPFFMVFLCNIQYLARSDSETTPIPGAGLSPEK